AGPRRRPVARRRSRAKTTIVYINKIQSWQAIKHENPPRKSKVIAVAKFTDFDSNFKSIDFG
ncbi:MAG: hypothetical protein ACP5E2_17050, partial [Terracidiphilus sp.]